MAKSSGATPNRSSLRDRYRRLGEDSILNAAQELFVAGGYRKTTMGAIADRAGVGVATVFRRFKSKEGVLAALSRRDIERILAGAAAAIAPPPSDPARGILKLLSAVLEMHSTPSAQIHGQTRIWLLVPTGHREIDQVVTSSDSRLQAMIAGLLAHYRRAGRFRKNIDLHDAAIMIFGVFYHHYLRIALHRRVRIAEVEIDLARQIPLLFKTWTSQIPRVRKNDT